MMRRNGWLARLFAGAVLIAGLIAAGGAMALTLDQARSSGAVGETARGYIAPVKAATPEVTALVNKVNAGRRAEYDRIARGSGTPLEQVEMRAAQKIFSQLPAGSYVQAAGGTWTRK